MSLVISIQSPIIYGTSTNPTGISGIEETVCFMENNKVDFGKAFYIQLQVCLAFVILSTKRNKMHFLPFYSCGIPNFLRNVKSWLKHGGSLNLLQKLK
jgi:hypothetical protein